MEDQLISFETAKLAKEKGFDVQTKAGYVSRQYLERHDQWWAKTDFVLLHNSDHLTFIGMNEPWYYAPTQSLLQKWLREQKQIHLDITYTAKKDLTGMNWWCSVQSLKSWNVTYNCPNEHLFIQKCFNSYEEALEAGLFESLKLI